jgi:hypothetical protein
VLIYAAMMFLLTSNFGVGEVPRVTLISFVPRQSHRS